jgi:hypothetical protein
VERVWLPRAFALIDQVSRTQSARPPCRMRALGGGTGIVSSGPLGWKQRAVGSERLLKAEGEPGRAVLLQVRQTGYCLGDRRAMSRRHPPECYVDAVKPLEPFSAAPHDGRMIAPIDVGSERSEIGPYRKVDEDALVLVGPHGRRIPVLRLEAPHEARGLVGEGVDFRQAGDKLRHDRVVHLPARAPDVDLGELECGVGHVLLRVTRWPSLDSTDAHGEQHFTFNNGFQRVRHIRLQHERVAITEPMGSAASLDGQLSAQAMDHHVARCPMLGQAKPPGSNVNRRSRSGRLGVESAGELWKIEGNRRSGQPGAGMRPEPFVWLIHVYPLSRNAGTARLERVRSGSPVRNAG